MTGLRPSTEPYALLLARRAREKIGAVWALSETGATGPSGNRYGDAAGHTCVAVAGPVEKVATLKQAVPTGAPIWMRLRSGRWNCC